MRKFKFRAWFKNEGEMKNVAMNNVYEGNKTYLHLSPMPMSDYKAIELMQCTGLFDKNGREIYEGDLLFHKVQGLRKVEYGSIESWACYALVNVHNGMISNLCDSEIYEVVGNIYENQELLEESK